jgi:2-polyprenyl-3-methyl-5-hydroxy-6-metoxy-1,4-benzoquinol methylase
MVSEGQTQRETPSVAEVQQYWETHPLCSYEIAHPGSREFFEAFDKLRREDTETFAVPYWEFNGFPGKKLLDVGCGPGWLSVQYAKGGADVYAVDLTAKAVELTRTNLAFHQIAANVEQGNAEHLRFPNGMFDVVVSSGVLHHTPDTPKAIAECCRVLKPEGKAKLTLYYKGILHQPLVFPITRLMMKLMSVKHPGADMARNTKTADDFIREYDGAGNPVGVGYSISEWKRILRDAGFEVVGYEIHFFPLRFVPFKRWVPRFVHGLLDRFLGTMVYFELRKAKQLH